MVHMILRMRIFVTFFDNYQDNTFNNQINDNLTYSWDVYYNTLLCAFANIHQDKIEKSSTILQSEIKFFKYIAFVCQPYLVFTFIGLYFLPLLKFMFLDNIFIV